MAERHRRTRARSKQMCANAACPEFQQKTGMMGGCGSCGQALQPFYIAPTDEQLENFVSVMLRAEADRMGFPIGAMGLLVAVSIVMADPEAKARWLVAHRQVQDEVDALGGGA